MCLCVCVCVCVCVCNRVSLYVRACAFISFYPKWLLQSKLMLGANINVQVSDVLLQILADLRPQNFPHLRLHLQNSEIPTQQSTGIKMI